MAQPNVPDPQACLAFLPNELLALVFIAALPDLRSAEDSRPLSIRQAPLNVASVCSRWRKISLSTPQLWTQIFFDLSMYAEFKTASTVASAVAVFVERSVRRPLDISVIAIRQYNDPIGGTVTKQDWTALARSIARPLVASHYRWRMAIVIGPREVWQEAFDSDDHWSLSNLAMIQELDFGMTPCYVDMDLSRHDPFTIDISRSATLESLTIGDDFDSVLEVDEPAFFPRLHKFRLATSLSHISLDAIFRVLMSAPSLRELYLPLPVYDFQENTSGGNHRTLRLQDLREFHLSGYRRPGLRTPVNTASKLMNVLDRLTLPSLHRLQVEADDDRDETSPVLVCIRDMLQRSSPPLAKLYLHFEDIELDDLFSCLNAAPLVKELTLKMWMADYIRIAERLEVHPPVLGGGDANVLLPNICPRLQSLTLKGINLDESAEAVARMISSRSPPGSERFPDRSASDALHHDQVGTFRDLVEVNARHGTIILKKVNLVGDGNKSLESVLQNVAMAELVGRGLKLGVWPHGEYWDSDPDSDNDDDDE